MLKKTFEKNQYFFCIKIFNKLEWEEKGQMAFIWIIWKNSKYLCGNQRLELPEKVNYKDTRNVGHHNEFRALFVGERVTYKQVKLRNIIIPLDFRKVTSLYN